MVIVVINIAIYWGYQVPSMNDLKHLCDTIENFIWYFITCVSRPIFSWYQHLLLHSQYTYIQERYILPKF